VSQANEFLKQKANILKKLGPLLGLLLISVALALISDEFLTVSNLLNVARQISLNAIISVGMTLVILTGGIDLSVGSIVAIAGSITAGMLIQGTGIVAAVAAGLLLGGIIGAVNGVLITRGDTPPFIATMGMMTIVRGYSLIYTDGRPITGFSEEFRWLGGGYIAGIPVPVIIMTIIFIGAYVFLKQNRFGRYVYAIGGNEEAARLSGINTKKVLVSVYILAGLLAALSGIILTSRLNSAQPTAGLSFEMDAIAAVVLGGTSLSGGVGTIGGTLVGAMIIGVLDNGLNLLNVSSFYQQVAKGVVILLAVLLDRKKRK
jgi:ribose transport system permease protein